MSRDWDFWDGGIFGMMFMIGTVFGYRRLADKDQILVTGVGMLDKLNGVLGGGIFG